MSISTQLVRQDSELEGILHLQRQNLRQHLTEEEAADQGFLTAQYSLDYLHQMHRVHPSVIAVDGDKLAGYALVIERSIGSGHPLLEDLIDQVDRLEYRNRPLRSSAYVVVGQLCVARDYRGAGLVPQLYQRFRESLQGQYQYAITDISCANRRSLKAHLKVGFQVIHSFLFEGNEWDIVLWDWTETRHPLPKGSNADGPTSPGDQD
jgi:GNAT superfamily N-acetyltransferase